MAGDVLGWTHAGLGRGDPSAEVGALTRCVIDASAALYLSSRRRALRGNQYDAPSLLVSETTSALRAAAWRGELSAAVAERQRRRLRELPIRFHASADLVDHAWEISASLGWAKTYDAEYVALARLEGIPLLTIDERLRRGVRHIVDVLTPADL